MPWGYIYNKLCVGLKKTVQKSENSDPSKNHRRIDKLNRDIEQNTDIKINVQVKINILNRTHEACDPSSQNVTS
jgi:hypothetical protein